MKTYHIHINGIVQGIGFRPAVYQLAKEMQLNGYVKNSSDGLHIYFNATASNADLFFSELIQNAPVQSIIISSDLSEIKSEDFTDFSIVVEGDSNSKKNVLMSPDVALCNLCKSELTDKNNRRYRYPFITCTKCGPRYSIINTLPYERHNTTMQDFTMCESCNAEYNNISHRRFFSQTNSCNDCGIELKIYNSSANALSADTKEILVHIKNFLEQGKILAIKGIGGYLLLCNANKPATIQQLRSQKHRPTKPFAVLYPDFERVKNNFTVSPAEKKLLQSEAAPIVLLYPNHKAATHVAINDIAPGLRRLGVMLPCSPLLKIIADDFGKPLIATSANISGSPIIYKDEDALKFLFDISDYVVSYNRFIAIPQDDSVVQVSTYTKQEIILRRSRGYAPSCLEYKPQSSKSILATGAHLKSSFTLSVNENIFISQFLGSGESYESQKMYKDTLEHWLRLYSVTPDKILSDLHPDYFSHQYAIKIAEKNNSEIEFIQHHQAHFAAVLAENNLLHSKDAVLGVIWDGTGLGDDKNIWGGEFFSYENNEMQRCYHFDYFPAITGDKFALEPRIAALCTTTDVWPQSEILKKKFTVTEWNIYQTLITKAKLYSSSAGRIFDAVSSLLDICDRQTFEGEAAMYLQVLAEKHVEENGFVMDSSYFKEGSHYYRIPTASLMQGIIHDIEKGEDKNYIAAKFHYSLVCLIDIVAKNIQVHKICFSGGVFQNALLVDWIKQKHGDSYELFFHKNLSPNDENISFGQLAYYDNKITIKEPKSLLQQELSTHHS